MAIALDGMAGLAGGFYLRKQALTMKYDIQGCIRLCEAATSLYMSDYRKALIRYKYFDLLKRNHWRWSLFHVKCDLQESEDFIRSKDFDFWTLESIREHEAIIKSYRKTYLSEFNVQDLTTQKEALAVLLQDSEIKCEDVDMALKWKKGKTRKSLGKNELDPETLQAIMNYLKGDAR